MKRVFPLPAWFHLAARTSILHAGIAMAAVYVYWVAASATHNLWGLALEPLDVFDDVSLYLSYGSRIVEGQLPHRNFLVEYPLLACLWFWLPSLITRSFLPYAATFACLMLLANGAIVMLVARQVTLESGIEEAGRRCGWYTICFAVLCPLTIARFDTAPAAITLASAILWGSGRVHAAGAGFALGTLTKLFPALGAVPWMIAGPGRKRGILAFCCTAALGIAAWALLTGEGVVASIRYHTERGIEIESVYAGSLWLLSKATGGAAAQSVDHGARGLLAAGAGAAALAAPWLQAALVLGTILAGARMAPLNWTRFSPAILLAFVVSGKVLSPQYLIWLLPYFALMDERLGIRCRRGFLVACVLTSSVYPWTFAGLMRFNTLPWLLLNLRNAVLVWLLIILVAGIRSTAAPLTNREP